MASYSYSYGDPWWCIALLVIILFSDQLNDVSLDWEILEYPHDVSIEPMYVYICICIHMEYK